MKKKIIIVLLILVFIACLLGVGIWYLNSYYLPQKIKIQITKALSEKLNAHVALQDIQFSLFKGIVIEDMRIAEQKGAEPALRVKHLSASFLLLPSFKEKKIIFPSIAIKGAELNIVRLKDGTLNLAKFLPQKAAPLNTPANIPFLIYKLAIADSKMTFTDQTLEGSEKQTLALTKASASPGPTNINVQIQATLSNEKQATPLEFAAQYVYATKKIQATLSTKRLNALPYLAYAKQLPIDVKAFAFDSVLLNSEYSLLKKQLTLRTKADINNAYLVKDQFLLSGVAAILEASATVDLAGKNIKGYDITLRNLRAELQAPQLPDKVIVQDAKLTIQPRGLKIEAAKARLLDTAINCSGTLEDFGNPVYAFALAAEFPLSKAQDIAGRYVSAVNSLVLDGNAQAEIGITKQKDKEKPEFTGSLKLNNASLALKDTSLKAGAINGLIHFADDSIAWKSLSLDVFNKTLDSTATINNFSAPLIDVSFTGDSIALKAKIKSARKHSFTIEQLSARFFGSSLEANGQLDILDAQTYSADLAFRSQLDLADLAQLPQLSKETLAASHPAGICSLSGTLMGNIKNPAYLNSSLFLASSELKVYDVAFNDVKIQFNQEDGQLKIPQANASFYGGSLALNGLADITKKNLPYAVKIIADGVDLSLLKQATAMKDKELSGMFSSTTILHGELKSLLDGKGQGTFLVKDGYLWAFNPLAKLRDFLFIPRRQILVFKEAQGDFALHDRRLFTENLTLRSDIIVLACDGSIGFDKTLDFEITPVPVAAGGTQKTPVQDIFNENFARIAGLAIVTLQGTIDDPHIGQKVLTKDVIQSITKGIGENVGKAASEVIGTLQGLGELIFGEPEE